MCVCGETHTSSIHQICRNLSFDIQHTCQGSIMHTGKATPKTTRTKTITKHLAKILRSCTIVGFREHNQVVEAPLDMDREDETEK